MGEHIRVEICCGSAADVAAAAEGGADRAELSSCLYFGGLTPSVGTVEAACAAGIPVMAMVRPREGGFCYDADEGRIMARDARSLVAAGADGVVFGALTPAGEIDLELCRRIIEAADGRETVFHRAFDLLESHWQRSLTQLMELGVTRVLTSGFAATAPEGAEMLAALRRFAGGGIEILPGSGIRADNALELCRRTGCDQIHSSAGQLRCSDPSEGLSQRVSFTPELPPSAGFGRTDRAAVSRLVHEVRR